MSALRRRLVSRRPRSDSGVASLELVGMLPMAFVLSLIVFQVAAFLWVITSANEAVRQGARAQSLDGGSAGCAAVYATLTDSVKVRHCNQAGGPGRLGGPRAPSTVSVEVGLPILGLVEDFVPDLTIRRTAVMP